MKALGYVRVSTSEQSAKGHSLDAQSTKIKQLAALHEIENVIIIADPGASAKNLKRPGIQEVIAEIKAGNVSHLIIAKLDRLTRSVLDLQIIMALCEKHGVALMSVADSLDTKSAAGRLVINIMASVAQWEREITAERTADTIAYMKANSLKTGGTTPYGYNKVLIEPVVNPEKPKYKLVKNYDEQAIISQIISYRYTGLSFRLIAEHLNELKIPSKSGGKWHSETVSAICNRNGDR